MTVPGSDVSRAFGGVDGADDVVEIVVLEDTKVVTVLVVGNSLADVDVFPTDITLWGGDRVSVERVLKLYLLMAASAFGDDFLEEHPPRWIAPVEEEEPNRRLDGYAVRSVNAKISGEQRPEVSAFTFDSQIVDSISRMLSLNDQINEDAMNAAMAHMSLDGVRSEARDRDERPADWYWGEPDPRCPDTNIDRRRCDELPRRNDSFTPLGSGNQSFESVATSWNHTANQDALGIASASNFLTENTPTCVGVGNALDDAENKLRNQEGTFDARIPVSVNLVSHNIINFDCESRVVVLELAEANSEFRYS